MKQSAFRKLAAEALGLDLGRASPHGALLDDSRPSLFIPAAAGAGKTSGLALLTLEAIFAHGFPAESIVATTFTRKAADESRSRIRESSVAQQLRIRAAAVS
jgi:DNA helicase-2/ATP-dependent DNA helicase PcrA